MTTFTEIAQELINGGELPSMSELRRLTTMRMIWFNGKLIINPLTEVELKDGDVVELGLEKWVRENEKWELKGLQ